MEKNEGKKIPTLHRTCPECQGKVPRDRNTCSDCGARIRAAKWRREAEREADAGGFGPERTALSWGVPGGILLIGVAAVWFFIGWEAGYIYFYPPVLAAIGVYGVIKGLAGGR